jgi:2-polyprenyl-6-methoxyphenol hydroxylase-like FAD-dependent oxidoreductase
MRDRTRAETPEGSLTVRVELVVGADGRHSMVCEKAGFLLRRLPSRLIVIGFRLEHVEQPTAA